MCASGKAFRKACNEGSAMSVSPSSPTLNTRMRLVVDVTSFESLLLIVSQSRYSKKK